MSGHPKKGEWKELVSRELKGKADEALDWMTPAEKRAENLGVELKTAA